MLTSLIVLFSLTYISASVDFSETKSSAVSLGTLPEFKNIEILNQTYIDSYINWDFTEIDNNTWTANFSIDEDLWDAVVNCRSLPLPRRPACWLDLKNTYFPEFNLTQLISNLANMTNYPLRNLTSNWRFSNFTINLTSGTGSFTINFPDGFKSDEYAELGFGSTIISTSTSASLFFPSGKSICRTTNRMHVAYPSTTVRYTNSTDGITWGTSIQLDGLQGDDNPNVNVFVECSGNNVFVSWHDASGHRYMNSSNEGATWSSNATGGRAPSLTAMPYTGSGIPISSAMFLPNTNNIFLASWNATQVGVRVFNTSTYTGASNPTSTTTTIFALPSSYKHSPAIYINSSGAIFVAIQNAEDSDLYFNFSSDEGATWTGAKVSGAVSYNYPDIVQMNGTIYVVTHDSSNDIQLHNSTNDGVTWGSPVRLDTIGTGTSRAQYPSLTTDGANLYVFWQENDTANNRAWEIRYRKWNISSGWDNVVYWQNFSNSTYDGSSLNIFPNAKRGNSSNLIEVVWQNRTAVSGSLSVMYDFINLTAETPAEGAIKYWGNTSMAISMSDAKSSNSVYTRRANNPTLASNIASRMQLVFKKADNPISINNIASKIFSTARYITNSFSVDNAVKSIKTTVRSVSDYFTSNNIVSRIPIYVKKISQSVEVNNIASKISLSIKSISQTINIQNIASRTSSFVRMSTNFFTANQVTSRFLTSVKSIQQFFDINNIISKTVLILERITNPISLSSISSRFLSMPRQVTESIGINQMSARIYTSVRYITNALNIDIFVSKIGIFIRTFSHAFSLDTFIKIQGLFQRAITQPFSLSIDTIRSRILTAVINLIISFFESIKTLVIEFAEAPIPEPPGLAKSDETYPCATDNDCRSGLICYLNNCVRPPKKIENISFTIAPTTIKPEPCSGFNTSSECFSLKIGSAFRKEVKIFNMGGTSIDFEWNEICLNNTNCMWGWCEFKQENTTVDISSFSIWPLECNIPSNAIPEVEYSIYLSIYPGMYPNTSKSIGVFIIPQKRTVLDSMTMGVVKVTKPFFEKIKDFINFMIEPLVSKEGDKSALYLTGYFIKQTKENFPFEKIKRFFLKPVICINKICEEDTWVYFGLMNREIVLDVPKINKRIILFTHINLLQIILISVGIIGGRKIYMDLR